MSSTQQDGRPLREFKQQDRDLNLAGEDSVQIATEGKDPFEEATQRVEALLDKVLDPDRTEAIKSIEISDLVESVSASFDFFDECIIDAVREEEWEKLERYQALLRNIGDRLARFEGKKPDDFDLKPGTSVSLFDGVGLHSVDAHPLQKIRFLTTIALAHERFVAVVLWNRSSLADEERCFAEDRHALEILKTLKESPHPLKTDEITNKIGQSENIVTRRLPVLRKAGLVHSWAAGRNQVSKLTPLGQDVFNSDPLPQRTMPHLQEPTVNALRILWRDAGTASNEVAAAPSAPIAVETPSGQGTKPNPRPV